MYIIIKQHVSLIRSREKTFIYILIAILNSEVLSGAIYSRRAYPSETLVKLDLRRSSSDVSHIIVNNWIDYEWILYFINEIPYVHYPRFQGEISITLSNF